MLDAPTGVVDRSRGDLHPGGNPHFLTDPRRALQVAPAIAERLSAIDPGGADAYRQNLAAFRGRIEAAIPLAGGARAGEGQEAHHPASDAHLFLRLDWARLGGRARAEARRAAAACAPRRPSSAWRSARG